MVWKTGQSGNPNGRPKVCVELQEAARAHGPKMITLLVGIAQNTEMPPAARVAAASQILDRGYGKPAQTIQGPPPGDPDAGVIRIAFVSPQAD